MHLFKNAKKVVQGRRCASSRAVPALSIWIVLTFGILSCASSPPAGVERFVESVDAIVGAARTAGPAEKTAAACTYCHGPAGNGYSQFYPRLAGQPAEYLRQQLNAYRDGSRENALMTSMALALTEEEVVMLSEFFESQEPRRNIHFEPVPGLARDGEAKATASACASCHGVGQVGAATGPRLAGQAYQYLVKQMADYREGRRTDANGAMAAIAKQLTDAEIEMLAQYLSAL